MDDLAPKGCLHGAVVRSPHAHALIKGITLDLATDWSDVVVVTAADVPGANVVVLDDDDQPVLAEKVVRYVGEAVVLVAAPTPERARQAAARITVDYRPLPALLEPHLSEDHPRVIYGEDNVFARAVVSRGAIGANHMGMRIEGTYTVAPADHHCAEPCGAVVVPEAQDAFTVLGPILDARSTLTTLTRVLGHDRIVVKQVHVGGSFGRKLETTTLLAAQAALLAHKAGAPVKLVLARSEESQVLGKRHGLVAEIATNVDMDGRLETFEARLTFDGGAYCTRSRSMLERAIVHALGPYRCDDAHVSARVVATHRPPSAPFRGGMLAALHFAIERHMDRIARSLSLDPLTMRRANLLKHGDQTLTGQVLERPTGSRVMEAAIRKAGAKALPEPQDRPGRSRGAARLLAGRGVSVTMMGAGAPGDDITERSGELELILRKQTVRLYAPGGEAGQGTDTGLVQVVARALNLPGAQLEIRSRSSDRVGVDGPILGSRGVSRAAGPARSAARSLKKAVEEEMKLSGEFAALIHQRRTNRKLEVRAGFDDLEPLDWDAVHRTGDAYRGHTWHCAVVDVVVDADTGEVKVRRVVTATDAGEVVHGKLARGQIEGAVVMGLGSALSERLAVDESGAFRTADFRDAGVLTTLDAPRQDTLLLKAEQGESIRGLGEVGGIACVAALAQAIEAATGGVLEALPMAPEHVLQAIP